MNPHKRPRIIITGGAGFLGSHLVRAFLSLQWDVFATHRKQTDLSRLQGLDRLELVQADLSEGPLPINLLQSIKANAVIHCAAFGVDYRQQNLEVALNTNVASTAYLVAMASQSNVRRFIHIGSALEYGPGEQFASENSRLDPQGIYGVTKAASTLAALDSARHHRLHLNVVRPFGIYGPHEGDHKFIPMIINALLKGEPLALSPGTQIRDYVFINDIAEAIVSLVVMKSPPEGEIFNLGSGQPVALKTIGNHIQSIMQDIDLYQPDNSKAPVLQWGAEEFRHDEIMRLVADPDKSFKTLGWKANTSIIDGLTRTIINQSESYRKRNPNRNNQI